MPPTMKTRTPIFCASGSLLREAIASCAVRATSKLLGRVLHAAGDFPVDRAGIGLLRSLLDGNVREELRGLQLLREGGEIVVRHCESPQGRDARLLAVVVHPDTRRDDGRDLVEDLHRSGAALLQGVEDLDLVLERLLLLGDVLHLARRLLALGSWDPGGSDRPVDLGE